LSGSIYVLGGGENLKMTMMDAAIKYAEANIQLCLCTGFVRMAPAPARQGVIATARESIRYIPAGTRTQLLIWSK